MESELVEQYLHLLSQIKSGNQSGQVRLMGVTKTVPVDTVNILIDAGLNLIGENRVQEFLSKYDDYHKENLEIHFIGHLQRNKVKYIIDKVHCIESVDCESLAQEIQNQAKKVGRIMDILIEVNIGAEQGKSGVLPHQLPQLLDFVSKLENVRLRGLMAIPPIWDNQAKNQAYFCQMYKLFIDIRDKKIDNGLIDCLSMGMSGDYLQAIACGSTQVRIGSSLFGTRKY